MGDVVTTDQADEDFVSLMKALDDVIEEAEAKIECELDAWLVDQLRRRCPWNRLHGIPS